MEEDEESEEKESEMDSDDSDSSSKSSFQVDLSNYFTKEEVEELVAEQIT